ncbi:SDR family NAD(P)-dependent oxidoreductase [Chitinophaga sancti]|uniref:SDR family NAD(P)-dependent oxidoreductase n=1 Tax=Chitinophaga sancti TaxID=1004 RepID=UPI002A75E2F7|nr:SDR family NAD(P)-dependent oxidoreductase [Chitinophaga sancti]WPQ61780.1 SDR family NAD(P)-dependent oxidoreductase [Chitinophaga sancti]
MKEQFIIDINHPVICNHKVYGKEMLPGLAYIDMLYQVFREHGYSFDSLELRNVVIHHPLTVTEALPVALEVRCTEDSSRCQWQITIEGTAHADDVSVANTICYVTAEMHQVPLVDFDEQVQLDIIKQAAVVNLDKIYQQCHDQDLCHTGLMKAHGDIYVDKEAHYIDISAAWPAEEEDSLMFHPALIDGSAIGASELMAALWPDEQQLYLPLYFESFKASHLFDRRVMARIQASTVQRLNELLYVTIDFFNATGVKIGELKKFASKLIRHPQHIDMGPKTVVIPGEKEETAAVNTSNGLLSVEKFLKNLIARHLAVPAEIIDIQAGYYEMGLGSASLLAVIQDVEKKLNVSLSPVLLFEYPSIPLLSAHLLEHYPAAFHQLKEEPAGMPVTPMTERIIHPVVSKQTEDVREVVLVAEEIAVIGIGGRYPGADSIAEFWQNLLDGKDCITEIPKTRWNWENYEEMTTPSGKKISRWGGFINHADCFDAQFFRISPREAEIMDPQERVFLEVCWEAIEDAGYTPDTLVAPQGPDKRQAVGVFVGVMHKDYTLVAAEAVAKGLVFPLSLNYAPIANRVSYFCNFHGPSMAIDTVCSSSLTALHLALESIRRGECEVALAGGVNLSLHPHKYLSYGMSDMHSSDGYCHTFGKGGDGYVSGEGVGTILLKPLSKALKDKDHIYAVIKGSVINHVGTVSGLMVPSPVAQANMISACMEKTGIHPRTISYVEAHGTGTSLGDPIEIQGLVKSYGQYTQDKEYCAIGSVKSNIGHAESAAGISGISKVILQLYHKTLVPSLHSLEVNPYLQLSQTPFYIQHETEHWKCPVVEEEGQKKVYPRRAAVSSFGATGSNAHVILEEYIATENTHHNITPGKDILRLIPLSAKNEERLQEYVLKVLDFLKYSFSSTKKEVSDNVETASPISLTSLAYTLQVGREAMPERIAFVAATMEELIASLEAFSQGQKDISNCWRGNAKKNRESLHFLTNDEDAGELIQKWIDRNKVEKLAELWAQGFSIDWKLFYKAAKPQRVSLPTYPFAKERYWVPVVNDTIKDNHTNYSREVLHPLLHKNTSDIAGLRFSSYFNRESGHEEGMTAGVAALTEMAASAVAQATGIDLSQTGIQLKDMAVTPCALTEKTQLDIRLYPLAGGELAYEIYGITAATTEQELCMSGVAATFATVERRAEVLSLPAQAPLNKQQCYEKLAVLGRKTRAGQGLDWVITTAMHAFAGIDIPEGILSATDPWILHPVVLESCVEACLLWPEAAAANAALATVGSLSAVEIFDKMSSRMIARIGNHTGDSFDIDLFTEEKVLSARITGVCLQAATEKAVNTATHEVLTFEENWAPAILKTVAGGKTIRRLLCFLNGEAEQVAFEQALSGQVAGAVVVFVSAGNSYCQQSARHYSIPADDKGSYAQLMESIYSTQGDIDGVIYMWEVASDLASIVYLIQALKGRDVRLVLGASLAGELAAVHACSLIGFERSLGFVMPGLRLSVLYEADRLPVGVTVQHILQEWEQTGSVLYRGGTRYIKKIGPSSLLSGEPVFKTGGVYLITGGFGGLGHLLAGYLSEKYKARLILTGRSALDAGKQAVIKELESSGSRVIYIVGDVCDRASMQAGIKAACEVLGPLNGVLHAAGIEGGGSIADKDFRSFMEVVHPKIRGTVVLDELLEQEVLDFVCYFSSSSAILGDFGTCDYAVGNRFQMEYAAYRNSLVAAGKRHGQTVAINWPLWRDGGMGVKEKVQVEMYLKSSGQNFLEIKEGFELLEGILSSGKEQVLVINGNPDRVHRFLGLEEASEDILTEEVTVVAAGKGRRPEMKGLSVTACVTLDLREQIGDILKLSPQKIDPEENLVDMGYDSVSLTKLATSLSKHYELEITPALFFGYTTLNKLGEYFMKEHTGLMTLFYRGEVTAVQQRSGENKKVSLPVPPSPAPVNRQGWPVHSLDTGQEPIAIIGISGRFPDARNVEEMWDILSGGKTVVDEIPADRFDWQSFFGDTVSDPGKINTKWCGCIPGVKEFDPLFFEISPREAETMDPRQRLLLQESWKALEDAGYGATQLKSGKVGVFVGVEQGDYQALALKNGNITSNHDGVLASRLSYFLNLDGPVIAINTACSSGLVAAHQACQSLRNKECDTAIAAGVNLMLTPMSYVGMSRAGMLSEDGKCFVFDKRANGMVPGEAVVAVVLKRLSRALEDGDPVYAVIRGSGINYDGKTNGITAPSGLSQASLLKEVYDRSNINPEEIAYVVAHGTGTKLGDPVEVNALNDAFKKYTDKQSYCALTSAKTNFGHTFAASGLVSLINLVQAMQHNTIPASLHFEQKNDFIQWASSPFYVNQQNRTWLPQAGKPLTGAVSAFGMSGTNAHMVVQTQGSTARKQPHSLPYYLLPLSAKTAACLEEKISDMILFLESGKADQATMHELSYTLQQGRQHLSHRCAIVVASRQEAIDTWKLLLQQGSASNIFKGTTGWETTKDDTLQQQVAVLLAQSEQERNIPAAYRNSIYAISDLYCKGYEINWTGLYGANTPARIHLPTYPFAKESYWVAEDRDNDVTLNMFATPAKAATTDQIRFLEKNWQPLSIRSQRARKGRIQILVTAATRSLGAAVAAQLVNSDVIGIEDIGRWDATSEGLIDLTGCEAQAMPGLHWLPVIQQFIEEKSREGIRLLGVTFDLERYGNKKVQVSGALHGGLYRMLGAEYRQVSSCHLDVLSDVPVSVVAEQIAAAYLFAGGHTEICCREGQYYTSVLTEQTLKSKAEKSIVFGENEVLWITGGTRGIGYLCAEHFVRHYGVRRLVLSGREVLPAREEWARVIAANGAQASKLKGIQHLESLGATVEILTVDITDAAAVSAQVTAVKSRHGRIGGVIHAAGIIDVETPAFIRKTQAGINAVLSAKVKGLEVLYACLREEPLQFFVMYSSVSSQIPVLGAGQSDYTMGNAYMDYFAHGHQEGFPVLSIQWPSWKETGMGEIKSKSYTQTGLYTLSNRVGLEMLDRILQDRSHPVIMPAVVNIAQWAPGSLLEVAEVTPPQQVVQPVKATALKTDLFVSTVDWLTEIFTKELKIDKSRFETRRPFPDYGIDSVLLSQIRRLIEIPLGEQLDPSVLLEHSSIEHLSVWLIGKYNASLSALLNDTAVASEARAVVVENVAADVEPVQLNADITPSQGVVEDIAVVGLSCQFPGAKDLSGYWQLLSKGQSAINPVPFERWGYSNEYYAGLIDEIGHFDAPYFMIPPEDVSAMDPQALLLLEQSLFVWHHAGYTAQEIKGKSVGVYIGGRSLHRPDEDSLLQMRNPIVALGQNYLATNISRFFDLRGPSMVVDTACSSALVGMNLAVQALQSGEITAAMVGGVGLLGTDNAHRMFHQRNLLSKDDKFHIFDQRAAGIVLGEGAGMVILKKVSQAVRDGDKIYAVIKGIAINNDGRTAGPATPNIQAQKEVMTRALLQSNKLPGEIGYIETNGSGSEVTDLLELKAMEAVYRSGVSAPCALGSVKPNIGHPLCAEGIAGFIKVVLMLMEKQQVPFLSGEQAMQHYNIQSSPFYFNRQLSDWDGGIAALNCFADGGTNAHLILAAWEEQVAHNVSRRPLPPPALNRKKVQQTTTPQHPQQVLKTNTVITEKTIWETYN